MGRIHNIEGRKNKQDSKRAAVFTKYARLIAVAAKEGGGDPEYNPSLKTAIEKAKSMNMPNDNIDRAIKKGTGSSDGEQYENISYEGYGPGGVAMIVETLTDNKNRTAGNIRHFFDKNGGNLGTDGCVSFIFNRKGSILIEKADGVEEDTLMETALDSGAEDFVSDEDGFEIFTAPQDFFSVKESLEKAGYKIYSSEITMIPVTTAEVDASDEKKLEHLIDMLEDDDDVQQIYTNLKPSSAE